MRWWRRRHTLISLLEEGAIDTIAGVVKTNQPLLSAPLSGRACVLYDVRHRPALGTEFRQLVSQNFWVEDATGRAVVRMPATRARVTLERVTGKDLEGVICRGDWVVVRGRVTFHVVPDPWERQIYREARAVAVLYGEGGDPLAVAVP